MSSRGAERAKRARRLNASDSDGVRKLQELISTSDLSMDGLNDIIKTLQKLPVDTVLTDECLRSIKAARFMDVRRCEKLVLENGAELEWEYADPNLLMELVLHDCPKLAERFVARLKEKPCTKEKPWSMVAAFDEFTPGDNRKPDNQRKSMVLSFSFLQLGPELLCHASCWFVPVVVRTTLIRKVKGHWSHMLSRYLQCHLLSDIGISIVGVVFKHAGVSYTIWAKLDRILADGEGHAKALDWMGASAMHPCFKHANVLKKGSMHTPHSNFVEISCSDPSKMKKGTSEEHIFNMHLVIEATERFNAELLTGERYKKILTSTGLNPNPDGLLANRTLMRAFDIINIVYYDPAHTSMQGGFVNAEFTAFLSSMHRILGVERVHLKDFLQEEWQFPCSKRHKSRTLWQLFNEYHPNTLSDEPANFKCQVTEMLALYGLLRHFIETRIEPDGRMAAEVESFYACCKVVDLMMLVRSGSLSPDAGHVALSNAYQVFLRKHIACYGDQYILPKHHWMFDIIEQLRHGFMDMLLTERLHLSVKRNAERVRDTRTFERSVLTAHINDQIRECNSLEFLDGLRGPRHIDPLGIVLARQCRIEGMVVTTNDVVRCGNSAGRVAACCENSGIYYVIVDVYELECRDYAHSARWRSDGLERQCWRISNVCEVLAWMDLPCNMLLVVDM